MTRDMWRRRGQLRVAVRCAWRRQWRVCALQEKSRSRQIPAGAWTRASWHVTSATDIICGSNIGFDVKFARQNLLDPSIGQRMKDAIGVGGHVYGHGNYFAEHALYSSL